MNTIDPEILKTRFNPEKYYHLYLNGAFGKSSSQGWHSWNGLCPFHNDKSAGSFCVNKRPDDYIQGEGGTKMLIQYTKARHLSGDQVQDIEAELHNEEDTIRWTWEQGNIQYQKAIEMMKNKLSLRDIAEELDISKSTIGRWKTKAQSEGLL